MEKWILICPKCETENEAARAAIIVDCGDVSCPCVCINCSTEFEGRQPYWHWLGLDEGPDQKARIE